MVGNGGGREASRWLEMSFRTSFAILGKCMVISEQGFIHTRTVPSTKVPLDGKVLPVFET